MPGYGDLNTVVVTGTYVLPDGTGTPVNGVGSVVFEFPETLTAILDAGSNLIVVPEAVTAQLVNGHFSVVLPATNDPDVKPTGWSYKVTETISGASGVRPRVYYVEIPWDVGTIDLADVIPADVVGTFNGYVLQATFDVLEGRVRALEAGGPGSGSGVTRVNGKGPGVVVLTPGDLGADIAGAAAAAQSASQPADPGLQSLSDAALTPYGIDLLTAVDQAAAGSKLGLATAAYAAVGAFDAAGAAGTAAAARVAKVGDTMTGPLILPADPVSALQAATKQYVDAHAAGFTVHPAVRLKSLPAQNINIATGLAAGQTLDGQTIVAGDRILLGDQTVGSQNGVYVAPGSGAATRATDADTGTELDKGAYFLVNAGTQAGSSWAQQIATPTLGTTTLVFGQVSGPISVSGGTAITVVGSTVSVSPGGITDTEVATANKDGLAAVPSLRTIGPGATQVVAGNDSRLSDSRVPTSHAASHTSGGTDALTLAQSQVTGLVGALTLLAPKADPLFTTKITTPLAVLTGIAGAGTPIRFVGGSSAKPTTGGPFIAGDLVVSPAGTGWICTTGGTFPGTPPVFVEIGAALTQYALGLARSYTDQKFNAVPELASSNPAIIALPPPVNGVQTLDVSALEITQPLVGWNTVDQVLPQSSTDPTNQTVTGLFVPVTANTLYKLDLYLWYKASELADLKLAWRTPTPTGWTGLWAINGLSPGIAAAATEGTVKMNGIGYGASAFGIAGGSGVTQQLGLHAHGVYFNTTTAGTLRLLAAQGTSHASDVTIGARSVLIATPIG